MRIQIPASLTKRKLLKGTVDVISNDSLFMEWNFQFTTVPFKPFCDPTKLSIFTTVTNSIMIIVKGLTGTVVLRIVHAICTRRKYVFKLALL